MNFLAVGNSEAIGAAATYRQLRERRLLDLLGRWVSELEPLIMERVDVSPHILAEIGLGIEGDIEPRMVERITVQDMIEAGALEG